MDIEQLKGAIFLAICFLNLLSAIILWRRGKSKDIIFLGLCFLFCALLNLSWAGVYLLEGNKLFWSRLHWIAGLLGTSYLIFVYYFTGNTKYIQIKILFWTAIGLFITVGALVTPYFIATVEPNYPYVSTMTAGVLNKWARLYVITVILIGFYYLIKEYYRETGLKKWQLKFFVFGVLLFSGCTAIVTGLLPLINFGNFVLSNEISAYASVFFVAFTSYAILKHQLFEIKSILTEYLVFFIWIISAVQIIIVANFYAKIISLIILILYIIIGYLLIKSTRSEIKKEEEAKQLAFKLKDLNDNLEKIVDTKTSELQMKVGELNQAYALMEKEKNKTLAIIANFTDPIIVLDKNNQINMLNPAAQKIFKLSPADLGREINDSFQFSLENFRSVIKNDYTIRQIGETADKEYVIEEMTLNPGGETTTYKVITAKVLGLDKEFLGTMKIFYDMTREKIIEKMKSDFVMVAAHQLRTPLSAVKWAIKLVLDGDTGAINDEQKKLLNQGYASNERVIVLINDMLNVSNIEEGRFGFKFAKCDFREILDKVLAENEYQLKNKSITLIKTIPDKTMEIVADQEKILMVVQNLMENAVNYTPEFGKIEIIIGYGEKYLNFTVKDNGVGIPAKDQEKLFSKFFRADNVIRIQTEGSGLGLFIVKNIVDRHKGHITFRSEEGRGTEFNITLPIK